MTQDEPSLAAARDRTREEDWPAPGCGAAALSNRHSGYGSVSGEDEVAQRVMRRVLSALQKDDAVWLTDTEAMLKAAGLN